MNDDCDCVLFSQTQIEEGVRALASRLTKEYQGKNPLFVCILKGSVFFFSDLVRWINIPCELDFVSVSSYGRGTVSGELTVKKDLSCDVSGRHVVLVEDIIDSGNTLFKLKNLLKARNPASLKIVTLLDKPARREAPISADDSCFTVGDEFVVGYGLDYAERYRNLPFIGVLKRCVYEK